MKLTSLRIAFVGLFLLGAVWATQQQDFSKVEIKTTPVRGNIYMLEGQGGNIGVCAGNDGILIVDDQFAPLAEKIRAALKGLNSGNLKFLLNTHWHGDHTGGNPIFGKEATIIAHGNVRKRLMTEQKRGERVIPPLPKEGWPVIAVESSLTIHFNDEEIKVVHFPNGHTDGDCVIFFTKANVVHLGDDFFVGRFPFVDLNSGGDVEGLIKNIETVIAQLPADVKIIPGHGPISTRDDLKLYHRMLLETTKTVRQGIAAGKSLEDLKKQGFAEEWKTWGTGFIKTESWIETIHTNFTAKKN
jgi:glyoxylase-like metal-dependent hydrolase (beta-lactamase superfamily II)